MKISDIEIFENYLSGSLTGTSLEHFEQKLQNSKAFRTGFQAYKSAFEALNEEPKWTEVNNLVNNLRSEEEAEKERYFKTYQNGDLSDEEKEIFNENLKEDEFLNYQFEKFKHPQKFDSLRAVSPKPEAKIVSFRSFQFTRVVSIAAMLVLTVGVFWWVNNSSSAINDQLFTAYYDAPSTTVVKVDWAEKAEGVKITNSQLSELKDQAISNFEAGNWHKTIEGIENYVKNSQRTDDTYYLLVYAGVSYMELGLFDKAIETLTFSMENIKDEINNSRRKETVQWYLALSNLKSGNNSKFVELAQPLTHGKNKRVRTKAQKILCDFNKDNCQQ